jgi:hypothetical protein
VSQQTTGILDADALYINGSSMEAGRLDGDDLRRYYGIHIPEAVELNPGFVRATRWELLRQDPRDGRGPQWLNMFELDGPTAVQGYLDRNAPGAPKQEGFTPAPTLSPTKHPLFKSMWEKVATSGAPSATPVATAFVVGMDVPDDLTEAEAAEFETYFLGTHAPEVREGWGYDRFVAYRLLHDLGHKGPRAPRYLMVYTADADATEVVRERRERAVTEGEPPRTPGPAVWDRRDGAWRLHYEVSPW